MCHETRSHNDRSRNIIYTAKLCNLTSRHSHYSYFVQVTFFTRVNDSHTKRPLQYLLPATKLSRSQQQVYLLLYIHVSAPCKYR